MIYALIESNNGDSTNNDLTFYHTEIVEVDNGRKENELRLHRFPHANTDTNMYVESFHNRLKTFYLKRRANRRVDDLLNLLLKIEEDDYWRHRVDNKYERQENIQKVSLRSILIFCILYNAFI